MIKSKAEKLALIALGQNGVKSVKTNTILNRPVKFTNVVDGKGETIIDGGHIKTKLLDAKEVNASFLTIGKARRTPTHVGAFSSDSAANNQTTVDMLLNGDTYINTTTQTVMYYNDGSWTTTKGEDGAPGATGATGARGAMALVVDVVISGSTASNYRFGDGSWNDPGSRDNIDTTDDYYNFFSYLVYQRTSDYGKDGDSIKYNIYNSTDGTVIDTKEAVHDGSNWMINVVAKFHGSVIVDNTLKASSLVADTISGLKLSSSTAHVVGNKYFYSAHDGESAYALDAEYTSSEAPSGYDISGGIGAITKGDGASFGIAGAQHDTSSNIGGGVYGNSQTGNGAGDGFGVLGVSTHGIGVRGYNEDDYYGGYFHSANYTYALYAGGIECDGPLYVTGSVSGISAADVGAASSSHTYHSSLKSGGSVTATTDIILDRSNNDTGNVRFKSPDYSDFYMDVVNGDFRWVYGSTKIAGITKDGDVTANSYSPFTGVHTSYLPEEEEINVYDVVKDIGEVHKVGPLDGFGKITKTTEAKAKEVLGVYGYDSTVVDGDTANKIEGYSTVAIASVGEGYINVCSENGDIETGDYICSSNVHGKGMKQDDDLMHNYTVAKARESIVWDDLTVDDIVVFEKDGYKWTQVACTYHCG